MGVFYLEFVVVTLQRVVQTLQFAQCFEARAVVVTENFVSFYVQFSGRRPTQSQLIFGSVRFENINATFNMLAPIVAGPTIVLPLRRS